MNVLAVVLTVILSVPGIPAKTYTAQMYDMESCEIAKATVTLEVNHIAATKKITLRKGDLKVTCNAGTLVSYQ